ncbi:hypothetical protein Ciccas_001680 [Cichlidogyrus casuarinus]|uniref:MyTH4 domain-containing protein n=1 Tax=Cichlidogyrus casuarinus TaxID=1844966 RepID=A0ABD2QJC6_9PLAT
MQVGDLIELKRPSSKLMSPHMENQPMKYLYGLNLNKERSRNPPGYFPRSFCQILPCVTRPSDDQVQRLFTSNNCSTLTNGEHLDVIIPPCVTPPIVPTKLQPLQFQDSDRGSPESLQKFAEQFFREPLKGESFQSMCSAQKEPLTKPLLRSLNEHKYGSTRFLSQMALNAFKAFLVNHMLTDEIYCQIIKQLTNNADENEVERSWQLLWLATGLSAPQNQELLFELHSWLQSWALKHALAESARQKLQLVCRRGPRRLPPTALEITAVHEVNPILAHRFFLPDGKTSVHLQFETAASVSRVREQLIEWLGTKVLPQRLPEGYKTHPQSIEERIHPALFGIYIELHTDTHIRHVMVPEDTNFLDFIRSVWDLSKHSPKYQLSLQKSIWISVDPGQDPVIDQLFHYPQEINRYLKGLLRCSVKDLLLIAGLLMLTKRLGQLSESEHFQLQDIVAFLKLKGQEMENIFHSVVEGSREEDLGQFIPKTAKNEMRDDAKLKESLLITYEEVIGTLWVPANQMTVTKEQLKLEIMSEILKILSTKITFGSRFFKARRGEECVGMLPFENLYIAVNDEAMFLVTVDALNVFEIVPHKRIEWVKLISSSTNWEDKGPSLDPGSGARKVSMLVHPVGSLVLDVKDNVSKSVVAPRRGYQFSFLLETNCHALELIKLLNSHRLAKERRLF